MVQYETEALVLGVKNWGNADKIVYLLSPQYGKINAVSYGCRRPKSVLAGAMQPFAWLDVQLTQGEKLDTIRQCEHKGFFTDLYHDLTAMAYGSFICELAKEITTENQPQEEIYNLLLQVLPLLTKRNPRLCALACSYQLFEHTGLQLHYTHCVDCGEPILGDAGFDINTGGVICGKCEALPPTFTTELREFIVELLNLNWTDPKPFKVNGKVLIQGEKILLDYVRALLNKNLKSIDFIKQVI